MNKNLERFLDFVETQKMFCKQVISYEAGKATNIKFEINIKPSDVSDFVDKFKEKHIKS